MAGSKCTLRNFDAGWDATSALMVRAVARNGDGYGVRSSAVSPTIIAEGGFALED